jgi:hypothetical protein
MFGIIFMAEWGDHTQFVMISLHASQPLWPVVIGSALAFLILCTSAVLCAWFIEASVVEMKLSKKTLNCIVAVAFVAFAIVSLIDGLHAMELGTDSSTRRPYKHSVQAQADADASVRACVRACVRAVSSHEQPLPSHRASPVRCGFDCRPAPIFCTSRCARAAGSLEVKPRQ